MTDILKTNFDKDPFFRIPSAIAESFTKDGSDVELNQGISTSQEGKHTISTFRSQLNIKGLEFENITVQEIK